MNVPAGKPKSNLLIKQAYKLPREHYKSLTWDRGKEMADHKSFSLASDIKVYFCDPQHPWKCGYNENTCVFNTDPFVRHVCCLQAGTILNHKQYQH